jgi:hypothetical protein
VLYFNGQAIKLRGVNRHDSDPVTGFTVDVAKIRKDLVLMKEHNFNAIRSSHYPNAPYFYQMCDRYGFLVCDEADIEAHGPFMLYPNFTDSSDCRAYPPIGFNSCVGPWVSLPEKIVSGEFGFKIKSLLVELRIQMIVVKDADKTIEDIIELLKH